jgi:GMP synthase (glutamine-hydrolysing)
MTTKKTAPARADVIRHLAFEDLGGFADVLTRCGFEIRYFDAGVDDLSAIDPLGGDLLIVLGGPISSNAVDDYPFLETEIDLLRRRIAADRPTLGICLGAQLIARALGARVYAGPVKEIGWSPLQLTTAARETPMQHLGIANLSVLHWHGETFDLPEGAMHLAASDKYPNQAFMLGRTLAMQFHAEVSATGLERWFIGHTGEINQTAGISVRQLRADTAKYAEAMQRQGALFFDNWLQSVS